MSKEKTDGKELFYRKDERFAHSKLVELGEKRPASVENLDRALLALFQKDFFDYTRQEALIAQKDELSPKLLEEFREAFIKAETRRFSKQLPITTVAEGKNPEKEASDMALREYKSKEKLITTLVEKEAWHRVLNDAIPEKALTKTFPAASVLKAAKVHETNMERLEDIVLGVQNKTYHFMDKGLDFQTGEIVDVTRTGTLWPFSKLVRSRRKGALNYINIKVEREMIQYVLFLHRNFIKYRLYVSTSLRNANATRTYETLVESMSPKYKNKWRTVGELMSEYGVSYNSGSDFLSKVVYGSVKKINKLLGTKIEIEKGYTGRKIDKIRFVISDRDARVLTGDDPSWRVDEKRRDTFGYFIALTEYFEEPYDLSELPRKAFEYNNLLEEDHAFINRHSKLFDQFLENNDAYDELLTMHDLGRLPRGYGLDFDLRVLTGADGKPLASTAIECLDILNKKKASLERTPSLFDAPQEPDMRTPECFTPFGFRISKLRMVTVTKENYREYSSHINIGIKLGKEELFEFENSETREQFVAAFFKPKALEAEVLPVSTDSPASEEAPEERDSVNENVVAEALLNFFRTINPKSRATLKGCQEAAYAILSHYEEGDIANVIGWLLHTKDGEWYRQHVLSPKKFSNKFDDMMNRVASAQYKSVSSGPAADINLLDVLEEI